MYTYISTTSYGGIWLRGLFFFKGIGTKRNLEKARDILVEYKHNPLCASLLGRVYYAMNMPEEACECWKYGMARGSVECIYQLGCFYFFRYTEYIEELENLGFELLCHAAEQDHPEALCKAGECLLKGEEVPMDTERAFRYLSRASHIGHAEAKYWLAICYWKGKGVARDRRRALVLSCAALLHGDDSSHQLVHWHAKDPQFTLPCGEWKPDRFFHQFVSDTTHTEIRTVLLMHARQNSIFSTLPRVLLPTICFWLTRK